MKALGCLLGVILSVAFFAYGLLLFVWQWIRRQLGIGNWPKQNAQSSQQPEEPKSEEQKKPGFFDDSEGEYVDYEEVKD